MQTLFAITVADIDGSTEAQCKRARASKAQAKPLAKTTAKPAGPKAGATKAAEGIKGGYGNKCPLGCGQDNWRDDTQNVPSGTQTKRVSQDPMRGVRQSVLLQRRDVPPLPRTSKRMQVH